MQSITTNSIVNNPITLVQFKDNWTDTCNDLLTRFKLESKISQALVRNDQGFASLVDQLGYDNPGSAWAMAYTGLSIVYNPMAARELQQDYGNIVLETFVMVCEAINDDENENQPLSILVNRNILFNVCHQYSGIDVDQSLKYLAKTTGVSYDFFKQELNEVLEADNLPPRHTFH